MFRQLLWPAIAVAMIIMPPTVLLCLPWTRARSKVRVTHIVRAFVYALAPIAALYGISLVVNMAASLYQLRSNYAWAEPWFARLDPFVPARNYGLGFAMPYHWLLLMWWLIYWWCVLKHGWRMNDHRKVFIALAIPALLASIILACFVPGAFTWAV